MPDTIEKTGWEIVVVNRADPSIVVAHVPRWSKLTWGKAIGELSSFSAEILRDDRIFTDALPAGAIGEILEDETIWKIYWNGIHRGSFFATDIDKTHVDSQGRAVVKVTGPSTGKLLEHATVLPPGYPSHSTLDHVWTATSVMAAWRALYLEAVARGTIPGYFGTNITATADSAGVAWSDSSNLTVRPGGDLLDLLKKYSEATGREWYVDHTHQLTVRAEHGVSREAQVVFHVGGSLLKLAEQRSRRPVKTHVYTQASDGSVGASSDAPSATKWGRREEWLHVADADDQATANTYAAQALATLKDELLSLTIKVDPEAPNRKVFVDYDLGDRVKVETDQLGRDAQLISFVYRIVGMTVEVDEDGATDLELVVNDPLKSRDVRMRDALARLGEDMLPTDIGSGFDFGGGGEGTPSETVVNEITFGQLPNKGNNNSAYSKGDHTHGTPPNPVDDHNNHPDPHTQYAKDTDVPPPGSSVSSSTSPGGLPLVGTLIGYSREDHNHGTPAAAAPAASGVGDAQAEGTQPTVARSDHRHAREAAGTPGTQAFADAPAQGTQPTVARSDHRHGMPTNPVPAHEAAADPHTGYQRESEKSASGGYAALDTNTRVPDTQLATGTPSSTNFLRGDRSWATATDAGAVQNRAGSPGIRQGTLASRPSPTGLASGELYVTSDVPRNIWRSSGINAWELVGVSSDDARFPTADEKAALVGTSGAPSSTNKYVTDADARNANARTPTAHASTHLPGGADALATATPTTIAFGDTAAEGGAASFARSNHVHGAPANPVAYATPAILLRDTAAPGLATTLIRSDATIVAFQAVDPTTLAFGNLALQGLANFAARRDHQHGMPANPVTAHEAAADPHAGYQKESEKGAASGYASLGVTSLVPTGQLGTGAATAATFLRGDGAWSTVIAAGSVENKGQAPSLQSGSLSNRPTAGTLDGERYYAFDVQTEYQWFAPSWFIMYGPGTPVSALVPGNLNFSGDTRTYARTNHVHGLPAYGTTAGTIAQGNDSRFTDARTPTAHASTHAGGGTDVIPSATSTASGLVSAVAQTIGGAKTFTNTLTVGDDVTATTAYAQLAPDGALRLRRSNTSSAPQWTAQPALLGSTEAFVIKNPTGNSYMAMKAGSSSIALSANSNFSGKAVTIGVSGATAGSNHEINFFWTGGGETGQILAVEGGSDVEERSVRLRSGNEGVNYFGQSYLELYSSTPGPGQVTDASWARIKAGSHFAITNEAGTTKFHFHNSDGRISGTYGGTSAPGITTRSGSNVFTVNWDGTLRFYIEGTNVKNFIIDHPVEPATKHLIHTTLEGPENAVFYRGEATLVNGVAIVTLPSYFEALTQLAGRTVQVTPVLPEPGEPQDFRSDLGDSLLPLVVPSLDSVPYLAASRVRAGQFTVKAVGGPAATRVTFFWEVKAVRKDVPNLMVEPRKDEVIVHGEGPYKYYSVP